MEQQVLLIENRFCKTYLIFRRLSRKCSVEDGDGFQQAISCVLFRNKYDTDNGNSDIRVLRINDIDEILL
jgi:hypothetical protein